VGDRVDLPPDCSAGDLAEVLEFLKVSPSVSPCNTSLTSPPLLLLEMIFKCLEAPLKTSTASAVVGSPDF